MTLREEKKAIAANKSIAELKSENEKLRNDNDNLKEGIAKMGKILLGQCELDENSDAARNLRITAENERLRYLLSLWWRNAVEKEFTIPKSAVEETIVKVAKNKDVQP